MLWLEGARTTALAYSMPDTNIFVHNPGGSSGKRIHHPVQDTGFKSIPGVGRTSRAGNGNPL